MNKQGQATTWNLFLDLTQIGFSYALEVENEFRRIGNYFKHHLLDLHQIIFWARYLGIKLICRGVEHHET
jgi:hypothetical protein